MGQEGILMRKVPGIAGEERRLILLPKLFHREVILNAHDRQGHQGADKTVSVSRLDSIGLEYIRRYRKTSDRARTVKHVREARPVDPFH